MVACTPDFELPYQQGTDRPCDLSEVWCLFADVVEAQLLVVDNIVNRTAVGVPFAKILQLNEFVSPYDGAQNLAGIPFDAIAADNDNMVDLPADPFHIYPRRPGIYMLDFQATVSSPTGNQIAATVRYQVANLYIESVTAAVGIRTTGSFYPHAVALFEVTAAHLLSEQPVFGAEIGFSDNSGTDDITITESEFTVTWIAEEVP